MSRQKLDLGTKTTEELQAYIQSTLDLISACAEYAGAQYSNPDANAILAQAQVATASAMTAIQSAQLRSSQRGFEPPQPVEPVDPPVGRGG